MYELQKNAALKTVSELFLSADPGTHGGENTSLGLLFNWELAKAFYATPQMLPRSKLLHTDDFEMCDELKAKVLARKITRESALR